MTAAIVVLASALALAIASLVAGALFVRGVIRDARAIEAAADQDRANRRAAENERDTERAGRVKAETELAKAVRKVGDLERNLDASRAEFAAYVAKKQETASDAEAIEIVDGLIARRLT